MQKITVHKICIKCNTALTDNNWSAYTRSHYVNKCVDCIRTEKREYNRVWRAKNPLANASKTKKYKANLRIADPVKSRAISAYNDARKRSIERGMPFDLTSAFVVNLMRQSTECPYFHWTLTHLPGKQKTLASLDRVDSAKGYTVDNVCVISYLANLMKSSADQEELHMFAQGILSMKGKK